jgi:hypothetical protein
MCLQRAKAEEGTGTTEGVVASEEGVRAKDGDYKTENRG